MAHFFIDDLTNYPLHNDQEMVQDYDEDFCKKLTDYFLRENKTLGLTELQSLEQEYTFRNINIPSVGVYSLLDIASIGAVQILLTALQSVPENEAYWNEQRSAFYINEVTAWLTFRATLPA